MAPAGSFESLTAALKAGTDSVYFGVEQLNMRARSSNNFTLDDIVKVVGMCSEKNAKAYLTLNTILYDHDIRLMKTILDRAKSDGVAAVIASDHAALAWAKQIDMPVHISTQVNITNVETVAFYAAFADVVVLSRELTLAQIERIAKEVIRQNIIGPSGKPVRLEVFAHGALCMAVSGKCYLSLHTHYASANRGACVQNCRREYIVTDKEEGFEYAIENEYIMSAKDLCTIDFLDKILNAGVSILKIEGRARPADYVYMTTKCYREAVDAISNGSYTKEKISEWNRQLSTVFNRGFWDGYYLGRKMGEWTDAYGSKATERKIFVGKSIRFFDRINVGEFEIQTNSLRLGDEILITGPRTGVLRTKVDELRVQGSPVDRVTKGDRFSMPLTEAVGEGDKLYKIVSQE